MQFLITVDDPEHGLGSGTERTITERVTQLVDLFGGMPGIVATLEVHEQNVYGITHDYEMCAADTEVTGPHTYEACSCICHESETGDPWLTCDICHGREWSGDLTPDWNGETGNHLSCEQRRDTHDRIEADGWDRSIGDRSASA